MAKIKSWLSRDWPVFLLLLVISFVLRSYSFFFSIIDWDESIYLLMANSLGKGNMPYTELWDNKPPGIYGIFLLGKWIFGDTLLGIRILSCIAVALNAFLIFKISKLLFPQFKHWAIFAGILYLVFSLNNGGLAANTELFFSPFTTLAFYLSFLLVLRERKSTISLTRLLLIGFVIGLGFVIKYLVLFDFLGLLAIMAISFYLEEKRVNNTFLLNVFRTSVWLGIGFLVPFLITVSIFYWKGYLPEFIDASFRANFTHSQNTLFSPLRFFGSIYKQIGKNFLLWLCLLLSPLYMYFRKDKSARELTIFGYLFVWLLISFFAVVMTKQFYPHYYLQLLPVMCLICYFTLILLIKDYNISNQILVLLLVLLPSFAVIVFPMYEGQAKLIYYRYKAGNRFYKDDHAAIAHYLRDKISKEDYIFIAGGQPIIYHLLDAKIPTRFAYPPFLLDDHFQKVANVDIDSEIVSIMEKKPAYVISKELPHNNFYAKLMPYVNERYELVHSIGGFHIYKRRDFDPRN